jgi:hypothetical protein
VQALETDRVHGIYLTLPVQSMAAGGQVVSFLTAHERNAIPCPALLERLDAAFRRGGGRRACRPWPARESAGAGQVS